jgi:hypothetical protein
MLKPGLAQVPARGCVPTAVLSLPRPTDRRGQDPSKAPVQYLWCVIMNTIHDQDTSLLLTRRCTAVADMAHNHLECGLPDVKHERKAGGRQLGLGNRRCLGEITRHEVPRVLFNKTAKDI